MEKKIILIAIIYIAIIPHLFAQQISDFKIYNEFNLSGFTTAIQPMCQLDYHIFIADWQQIGTLDSNYKFYNAFNTTTHPYYSKIAQKDIARIPIFFPSPGQYTTSHKYKNLYYFNGEYGLFEFEDNQDSIILLDIKYTDQQIADFYFDEVNDYLYLLHIPVLGKRIFEKINLNNLELVDTIDLMGGYMNKLFFDGNKFYWYSGINKELSISIEKEFKNENVEIYDFTTIKTKIDTMYPGARYNQPIEDSISLSADLQNALSLKNNQIRIIYVLKHVWDNGATNPAEKLKYLDSPLFICENDVWDTINLQAGFDLLNDKNAYLVYSHIGYSKGFIGNTGIFKWSDTEIAVNVMTPDYTNTDSPNEEDLRTLLIYNVTTKEWKKFVIPQGMLSFRYSVRSILNLNDTLYFIFSKSDITNDMTLCKYTGPRYTSIADEEAGLPELWFFKVYPNPITHHTVTADIMCYVQDISKVELGLYNLMGQKLLDLTNQFEYSESTHTINITFTIPDELPEGVYYLNVRKGTETRTKAIVIGK